MPIIAPHHHHKHPLSKDVEYTPSDEWPDDCYVQWGGGGVVLSNKGNYRTAFFEAFPEGPGFFRGEGATIAEAEKDCLDRYIRFTQCDHIWGRGRYLNGGATCRKCGAFASVMNPVTELGAYRKPISASELRIAAMGGLRPSKDETTNDASKIRYERRLFLRLRRAGIDLPEATAAPQTAFLDDNADPYLVACRAVICDWYRENYIDTPDEGGIAGIFSDLDHRYMERLVEEDDSYRKSIAASGVDYA
jgi:hypothetical protein